EAQTLGRLAHLPQFAIELVHARGQVALDVLDDPAEFLGSFHRLRRPGTPTGVPGILSRSAALFGKRGGELPGASHLRQTRRERTETHARLEHTAKQRVQVV